jgi:coenzyme F420-reducing hydrogenase delta subunit
MCSGRVDPAFVLKGFEVGADGVIVMGCHIGDCHYLEGNYEAEKKYAMLVKFLELIGLDNRVRLEWVSASEGTRYGAVVTEFTEHITSLGPSPAGGDNPDKEVLSKIRALQMAAGSDRMRALVGRQRKITEDENVYGEKTDLDEFMKIFDSAIVEEYERARVYIALEEKSKSIKEIAAELDIDTSIVLEHLVRLKSRGLVDFGDIVGITPMFIKL